MAYCEVADVQNLMGQTFTGISRPSTSEVQNAIDEIAAEIEGVAASVGYAVPITSTEGAALLYKYNRYGAAVSAWHTGVIADAEPARVEYWRTEYANFIARLRRGEQLINGETLNASPNAAMSAGFKRSDGYATYNPNGTGDYTPRRSPYGW